MRTGENELDYDEHRQRLPGRQPPKDKSNSGRKRRAHDGTSASSIAVFTFVVSADEVGDVLDTLADLLVELQVKQRDLGSCGKKDDGAPGGLIDKPI